MRVGSMAAAGGWWGLWVRRAALLLALLLVGAAGRTVGGGGELADARFERGAPQRARRRMAEGSIVAAEADALVELHSATGGTGWTSVKWTALPPTCAAAGITCDAEGHVVELCVFGARAAYRACVRRHRNCN